MTDVILALAGLVDEAEVVRASRGAGLRVVRRCIDAADLLGAAAADPDCCVVVAATLPRLTSDVIGRLGSRVIIGLAADTLGLDRLARFGVPVVLATSPTPEATARELADVCQVGLATTPEPMSRAVPPVVPEVAGPSPVPAMTHARTSPSAGALVAVWGPMGSPGRTTVSLALAESLAEQGARVCLVDADTYAPSIPFALGLVEETSGLSVVCRQADAGSLSAHALDTLTMSVDGHRGRWRVLGGVARAERWADLRPAALERVWSTARSAFDVTVVDVGFCAETDSSPAAWGRQRNAAAVTALSVCDHLIAVGDDTDLGALRLLQAWPEIAASIGARRTTVVRNRARTRGGAWAQAVGAATQADEVVDLPLDERSLRSCWRQGRSLAEVAPRSRLRRSVQTMACGVLAG